MLSGGVDLLLNLWSLWEAYENGVLNVDGLLMSIAVNMMLFTLIIGMILWVLSKPDWLIFLATAFTFLAFFFLFFIVLHKEPKDAGEWGSVVGGITAIPAVIWFITALFVQQRELSQQGKLLKDQHKEISRQTGVLLDQTNALKTQNHIALKQHIESLCERFENDEFIKSLNEINSELIDDAKSFLGDGIDVRRIDFDNKNGKFIAITSNVEEENSQYDDLLSGKYFTLFQDLRGVIKFCLSTDSTELLLDTLKGITKNKFSYIFEHMIANYDNPSF